MRTLAGVHLSRARFRLLDLSTAVLASVLLMPAGMLGLPVHASAAAPSVVGWGENEVGQLGNGTTINTDVRSPVAGLSGVSSVVAGRRYSLALLSNGTVDSWGENSWGQLGNGTETGPETCHAAFAQAPDYQVPCSTTPVQVKGLSGVTAIASGSQHGLALLSNGTVMAWGANGDGQLGDGTESNSDVPVPVSGLSEVVAIAAGQNSSFALLKNGTVMSWGENGWGILGHGSSNPPQDLPAPVSGLTDVTAIAVYLNTGLALLGNGTVESWGENELGELGDGTLEESEVPVPVSDLTGVRAVARGEDSVALLENGTVMAWGSNISGQLGIGTMTGPTECFLYNFCATTPVQVEGLTGVSAIAAGNQQNLALLSDGQVMAWGDDWQGQLGDGNLGSTDTPTAVSGLEDATAIAAGENFSLAYGIPIALPPSVTQVSPHRGTPAGGTSVSIEGANFTEVTAVDFGSTAATSYTVNSDDSITATAPAGAGTVDVTVVTAGGTSATGSADTFTYGVTVTGVEPDEGPQAGGTSVTITGSGFTGATVVSFGSTAATSFTVNSDSSITAVAPAGKGTVDVQVTTTYGTSPTSWADQFSYKGPTPRIESVSVSDVSEHDATLEAQINPNGLETTYQFSLWVGCYPASCQHISEVRPALPIETLPSTEGEQSVSLDLNSAGVTLEPNRDYYYSAMATNSAGETHREGGIFRTPSEAGGESGGTETGAASNVSETGATLNGVVAAWGWREATYVFEYGTSTSYGASVPTPAGVIGGRITCGLPCGPPHAEQFPVSENLTGLEPNTTYHYRLVSTSAGNTSYGKDATFTTSEALAEPLIAAKPPKTGSGQSGTSSTPTGSAMPPSTPSVTAPVTPLGKTAESKALVKAPKLAGALKACKKEPKRKQAACERKAHYKHAQAAAKKSKK
jgi:alpha-tubulin suppressor-like RCC1 family protein